jgi:ATP-binding cassette subfamily B protein
MKTKKKPHALFRLMRHSRQHRGQLMLASFFSVINKIVDLAPPILIGAAVDVVVSGEDSFIARFGIEDVRTQLIALAVISIIIWGFESLFQYLYNVLWRNLAQTIQHELRLTTYTHVQKLEMAYFEDRSTGGLLAVLNDDVNQLERFLDGGANDLIQVTTTVIVIGGIFAFTVPTVAWMALLPMPLDNISGIATIKSFTSEGFEVEHIRTESDLYRQKNKSAIQLSSAFVPMIRMVIVIGFTAIMVFGGQLAFEGVLNIGAYSVLVFMTQRLLWPLTRLGTMLDLYQRAMASTTRILDLVDTEAKITDGEENRPVEEVRGEITFKDVCFKYDFNQTNGSTEAPITVNDLSLDIPAGETVAIVGPTGSGKSTLVKLLLRLYDVKEGSITLDSVDIRDLRLPDLRGAIGFVSQDVFLFHGTVCENIRYGSFGASMDEVIAAAKIAEAHEFTMEELPHGYDTIVGERGQKLSGGQRQRISIARAILKDPPVLILDEATSSVDNETEAAIQRSLEKIVVGRTTIVIAHRLSTVRNADRIYVLERGVLKEQGRHEELTVGDGIYAGLWRVQTGQSVG